MKALDVAAHIINRCIDMGTPITNLKLQKMLYFLEINFLANAETSLVDENFEAWQYGPVSKSVYDKYSFFAASPIKIKQEPEEEFPPQFRNAIINNIDRLAKMDTWDLVNYSHKNDTPWSDVYNNGAGNHKEIPDALLIEYARKIRNG